MNRLLPYRRLPSAERIAEIIRRQFNVRTGLLTSNGLHSWLGNKQSVFTPFCDAQPDGCRAVYQSWFDDIASSTDSPCRLKCPVGLEGIAVPVLLGGECIAAVFASGIQPTESNENKRIIHDLLMEIAQEILDQIGEQPDHDDNADCILPEMISHADSMRRPLDGMEAATQNDLPILLTGPAGSGKDLAARVIHDHSRRSKKPFITLNCAGFSDQEIISELFGHRRGAFPDAFMDKQGLLDIADGGSLYIDDIDLLPMIAQSALAHFLQTGSFAPAGDSILHYANVRIMASTRFDLTERFSTGEFSENLYFRINTNEIALPPLSERREDIADLSSFFLSTISQRTGQPSKSISENVMEILKSYEWPGNIRELESEISRLFIMSKGDTLDEAAISKRILRTHAAVCEPVPAHSEKSVILSPIDENFQLRPGQNIQSALEEIERQIIAQALTQNQGNRTKTAEILGISRRNLIRKIESLKIEG